MSDNESREWAGPRSRNPEHGEGSQASTVEAVMLELLLFCGLGYVILGPQRMHAILQHIARAKVEFERTKQDITSQLASELDAGPKDTQD